jgi:hypothetical protein
MNGGPSQIDTFDMKPGHVNGGPFREIATSVPGTCLAAGVTGLLVGADTAGPCR